MVPTRIRGQRGQLPPSGQLEQPPWGALADSGSASSARSPSAKFVECAKRLTGKLQDDEKRANEEGLEALTISQPRCGSKRHRDDHENGVCAASTFDGCIDYLLTMAVAASAIIDRGELPTIVAHDHIAPRTGAARPVGGVAAF